MKGTGPMGEQDCFGTQCNPKCTEDTKERTKTFRGDSLKR